MVEISPCESFLLFLFFFRWEAFILLILYSFYIVIMVFNEKLESAIVPRSKCCTEKPKGEERELIQTGSKASSFDDKSATVDSALESDSDFDNPAQGQWKSGPSSDFEGETVECIYKEITGGFGV